MKTLSYFKNKLFLLTMVSLAAISSYAQEKKLDVDVDINKSSTHQWYTQPWIWVVGGAVFILLLVALLRSGGQKA